MTASWRRAPGLCMLAVTAMLAACDDTGPPSPLPATPARPAPLAPSSYLLRADQLPGYTRSRSETLTAGSLGDEARDPALKAVLEGQGLQLGARYIYISPARSTLAFTQVVTEAILFNDAAGAQHFVADETVRHNVPPSNGGNVITVSDLAATNADAVVGFSAQGTVANNAPPQVWLAVVRRGRLVVELLGAGLSAQATRAQFDQLLAMQEKPLATSPDPS